MTPIKKFGRPVVVEPDDTRPSGATRRISMTREGGALEGSYAAFSTTEELRLSPYAVQRREIISTGVKAWISLVLFWGAVAMFASTFIFAR